MTTFDSCVIDNGDDYLADVIVITTTLIHIPIISKFRELTTVEGPANCNHNFTGSCISYLYQLINKHISSCSHHNWVTLESQG